MGPRKTVLAAAALLFATTALPALAAPGRTAFVSLSEQKKLDHLKRHGVNAAHVTPARGLSGQTVDMQFVMPVSVRVFPTGQMVTFSASNGPGAVTLSFNTTKGLRYLVDCGVTTKGSLTVTAAYRGGWQSDAVQTAEGGHILVAFTAAPGTTTNLDGATLNLSSKSLDWTFTGCEVDEVQ